MKAFVNKSDCMFCGICGGISQEVFFVDNDRKMWASDTELEGELLEEAKFISDSITLYSKKVTTNHGKYISI